MPKALFAQVHRFGDRIAIHTPYAPTAYLTADEARRLGNALINGASELDYAIPFTASTLGTITVELTADALRPGQEA